MERLIAWTLTMALALGGYVEQGQGRVPGLLRQMRAALGGEDALGQVKAITATGTITRAAGDVQMSGDLTLQFQLPDRMLRTDALSPDGGLTLVSEQGFRADTLLRATRVFNAPPGAVIRTPPPPPPHSDAEMQALRAARADLARLTAALLLRTPDGQALEFTDGGKAEAPDGTADVLNVTSRDGLPFAARLFIDTATHRPVMLSYRGVAPRMVVQTRRVERGTAPATDTPRPDAPPPGDVVDIDLHLDAYRPVNGVLFPHHITRSVAGEVSEEWTFSSIQVNPTFKPGTFDPH